MIPKLNTVYFLGIGGIGMSAIARYLHKAGVEVHGYDKTPSTLTTQLEQEGMKIHFTDSPELIPSTTDLIIYTPAIPANLAEFVHSKASGIAMMKRSEFLGFLTQDKKTIAVAGTHGKTSVSSTIAHIFNGSATGCTAFLGGIAKNYESNILVNPTSDYIVVEADEFDRSFLRLNPWLAVITSADADHLDIYQDHQALKDAFADFTANIRKQGILLIKHGVSIPDKTPPRTKKYSYSINEVSDFSAQELTLQNGLYHFHLKTPEGVIRDLNPELPGLFNVENSIAAAATAWLCGLSEDEIRIGISSFSGVKRRFDQRINFPGLLYIDDYAHHPEELRACIGAARKLYPHRHITGIFQPHLFTRTRDFADDFAKSLAMLNRLILLEIYPARELPIPGVTSTMLLEKVALSDKRLLSREETLAFISSHPPDILLTLGAGDIDQLVSPIEELLTKTAKS